MSNNGEKQRNTSILVHVLCSIVKIGRQEREEKNVSCQEQEKKKTIQHCWLAIERKSIVFFL